VERSSVIHGQKHCAIAALVLNSYLMTPKQKRIIAILAAANIIVLLTLAILATHPPGGREYGARVREDRASTDIGRASAEELGLVPTLSSFPPPPRPLPYTATPGQQACQWRATRLLAQAGLCGTLTLSPDGPLRFEITHRLVRNQTVDQAAQSVWTAFDVALALLDQEDECATFTQIEVIVLVQGSERGQWPESAIDTESGADAPIGQIYASVRTADLVAFNEGRLREDDFVERVIYTATRIPG